MIDKPHHPVTGGKIEWSCEIPIKVICFIWQANQGRIPTSVELKKRGLFNSESVCSYCLNEEETTNYILFNCLFAKTI